MSSNELFTPLPPPPGWCEHYVEITDGNCVYCNFTDPFIEWCTECMGPAKTLGGCWHATIDTITVCLRCGLNTES